MAPKPPKHSTTDFLVVFGPRATYLVHTPGVELTSTLSVSAELQEILDSSKEINFVLYPPLMEDDADCEKEAASSLLPDPYVAYVKKKLLGDSKFYMPSAEGTQDDFYSGLKEWLGHRWGSGGIQVVANNKGGWWGLSKTGNMSFKSLPGDVRQLVKPSHPNGKVKHMALGVEGAYVVVFEDGHIVWDLKGTNDRLDAQLEERSGGDVLYVSLSPYRPGIFFAAFTDGTIMYDFPKDVDGSSMWEDLNEKYLEFDGLRVIISSESLKSSAIIPKRPSALRQFSEEVVTEVAKHEMESLME